MKRTILYNLNESEKAISSGGWIGKGYLEGTRTIGKFVPELLAIDKQTRGIVFGGEK